MNRAQTHALYRLLKQVFIQVDDGDRRLLGRYGLTLPRYYALRHIRDHPGISMSDLSQLLICDKSNITRIVKGLENLDYVRRKRDRSDERAFRLFLTERGRRRLGEAVRGHSQYNEDRFSELLADGGKLLPQLRSVLSGLIDFKSNGDVPQAPGQIEDPGGPASGGGRS